MRSIRTKRANLQRKIAIRDEVIHMLCYRWCIFNQEDNGHERADVFAERLIERARAGSLKRERNFLPPNVLLWRTLYAAYYANPGFYSMAKHPPLEELPAKVAEDAEHAAWLVGQYWKQMPTFKQWLEALEQVKPANVRTRAQRNVQDGYWWVD